MIIILIGVAGDGTYSTAESSEDIGPGWTETPTVLGSPCGWDGQCQSHPKILLLRARIEDEELSIDTETEG